MKTKTILERFKTWCQHQKGYQKKEVETWIIYGHEFAKWYKHYLPSACWRNVTADDVVNFCNYLEHHGFTGTHLQIAECAIGTIMAYVVREMERDMRRRRKAA